MRSITKKWIIAGAAAVIALGVLTACTKTVEETEGSAADLKKDFTVEMKGSYSDEEQNVFFATDVKIVEVVL